MKEDATLICPISYDDPDGHWAKVEALLLERLPLRDVTWKSPISSSFITISKLPLRFLPSDAGLFKDTDHPYRWFLSQYAGIYLLVAETLDSYKTQRQKVRKWIDSQNVPKGSLGKTFWILVYVTLGNYPLTSYQKVFTRISGDFYAERSGDRTVMIHLPPDSQLSQPMNGNSSVHSISAFSTSIHRGDNGLSDLIAKVREGIVLAFPHRSLLYDGEIRRLDSGRSNPQYYDFKQLFLVKESFALFYQMMQLMDMALAQYEELELMMSFAPSTTLPESQWPYRPPESLKVPDPNNNTTTTSATEVKDILSDVVKNGEDVVSYSMNVARMKVLKGKMSMHELHRYVFARQMFYLVSLQRPAECAAKAKLFLQNLSSTLLTEIDRNHAEVSLERTTKTVMLSIWCLTAAVKCTRVCRDLVDRIISLEGNGSIGLESIQSVTSILNVMKMSSSSYSNNFESSEIKEFDAQILPEQSSLRLSSVKKEKLVGYKDVFTSLSDLIDFAFIHFRRITPISRFAMKTACNLTAEDGYAIIISQPNYFSIFQSPELSERLAKEWQNFSANIDGNVGMALSSIAQRIRSVSRYWAKLLSSSGNETNLIKLDPNFIEEQTYLQVLVSCQLQSQQYDKGRILEVSLAALLHHTAAELFALSERKLSMVTARLRQIEIFIASKFHLAAIHQLQELLCIESDPLWYQRVEKNLCNWPLIANTALKWLSYAAEQSNKISLKREALAALCLHSVATESECKEGQFYLDRLLSTRSADDGEKSIAEMKWIILPTESMFSFCVECSPNSALTASKTVNRVINLLEEPFAVSWLEIACQQDAVPLRLTVESNLTKAVRISRVHSVFKRIPSDGLEVFFGMHHAEDWMFDESTTDPVPSSRSRRSSSVLMNNNPLAVEEDEFACALPSQEDFILQPGKQTIDLQFTTTMLGDFVIQRIILVCSDSPTVIFANRALDNITNAVLNGNDRTSGNELSNPMTDCIAVQTYFHQYPLLRIIPPTDVLTLDIYSGKRIPPNQFDQLMLSFHIKDGEQLRRLKLSIFTDSRCRRISEDYEGQSGLTLVCSPVVSYFKDKDDRSSKNILGSFDIKSSNGVNTSHFVEREFAVKVASAEQWDFVWSGIEEQPDCSIVSKAAIEVYRVDGGAAIQLRVPYYIATRLLNQTEMDEFTLQSQLNISVEGVIQKGPCAVPFSSSGSASLFCCNLIQATVTDASSIGNTVHVQFTLTNISIVDLAIFAIAFIDANGEWISSSSSETEQSVGHPEELTYASSMENTEELKENNCGSETSLSQHEQYLGFLSIPFGALNAGLSLMRLFYRRLSDRSDLNTILSIDLSLDIPLVRNEVQVNKALNFGQTHILEADYRKPLNDDVLYPVGQLLWFTGRMIRQQDGAWSLLIDNVDILLPAEYHRIALLTSKCYLENALLVRIVDTEEWMSAGLLCSATPNNPNDRSVEFALVSAVPGIRDLPPLKLLYEEYREEVLLLAHHDSKFRRILISGGEHPHSIYLCTASE